MNGKSVDRTDAEIRSENLSIELTSRCNSLCKHCFVRAGRNNKADLSPGVVEQICAEGFNAGYRHLHLTGGEPMLWHGLFELLDRAFALNYQRVFLNSNGTLFTADAVRQLARYDGLGVSVSLQGNEALHDHTRGQGAYRQAAQGIVAALDAGVPVTVFAAIGKTLLEDLAAFAAHVYKEFYGLKQLILIQMIRVKDDLYDLTRELLDPEDFLRMVRTVAMLNLCGCKTGVLNDPLVNVVAEHMKMPWIPPSHRLHRPGRLFVRANGDITLAHSTWERYGRYQPGMITRVLGSERYRMAVAAEDKVCPSCRFVVRCRKNGMIRPSEQVMDMKPEVPYCQRVLTHATR
jgi:MoaA/NifB/PqqE/SkfB family radical SAM enzyme